VESPYYNSRQLTDNAIVRNVEQTVVNEAVISSKAPANPSTKKFQCPDCSELIAVLLIKNGNLVERKKFVLGTLDTVIFSFL